MTKPEDGKCRSYNEDTKQGYREKPCDHTIDPSKSYCIPNKALGCPITQITFEKKDITDVKTGEVI